MPLLHTNVCKQQMCSVDVCNYVFPSDATGRAACKSCAELVADLLPSALASLAVAAAKAAATAAAGGGSGASDQAAGGSSDNAGDGGGGGGAATPGVKAELGQVSESGEVWQWSEEVMAARRQLVGELQYSMSGCIEPGMEKLIGRCLWQPSTGQPRCIRKKICTGCST